MVHRVCMSHYTMLKKWQPFLKLSSVCSCNTKSTRSSNTLCTMILHSSIKLNNYMLFSFLYHRKSKHYRTHKQVEVEMEVRNQLKRCMAIMMFVLLVTIVRMAYMYVC